MFYVHLELFILTVLLLKNPKYVVSVGKPIYACAMCPFCILAHHKVCWPKYETNDYLVCIKVSGQDSTAVFLEVCNIAT